ncbi:hypothetical protein Tsubulata_032569 [Turnera subulata]|uniref:Golgin candidate 2 n=1 Tax=Turnera subulata TaxID=218843 RepID=A0A9Q0JBN1_9ROSI|nr:hypothetical protein Tsubulata_032569 [Turnera subulata]
MANWITNKLKVAETFFEQIDERAAELKKHERPRSDEEKFPVPVKTGGAVPLKDQLKKKKLEKTGNHDEFRGILLSDSGNTNVTNNVFVNNSNTSSVNNNNGKKEDLDGQKSPPDPKPKPTLTDSDWTELLATPNKAAASSPGRGNAAPVIRGIRKDGRRKGSLGSNLSVGEGKRNLKGDAGGSKLNEGLDVALGSGKLNGKANDAEESSSSARSSSVELHSSDGKGVEGQDSDHKETGGVAGANLRGNGKEKVEGNGRGFESTSSLGDGVLVREKKNRSLEVLSVLEKVDGISDVKKGVGDVYDRLRRTVKGKRGASRSSVSDEQLKRSSSSTSDEGSDSDSESGSSSDSESERERERRERILAEKAAAKAVEAIKERENVVAKLEGEKQSLDKILEERAKQQEQEASELQTSMMEIMEAADLEKQKHNNTRMEALARLAKLETANADLARSLATAQKNLEVQINQVAELGEKCDLKEVAVEELRRRISKTHQTGNYLNQLAASKGAEFELEILEAEHSFLTDKIDRLQDKAKKLEADIEITKREMEDPTEVEIELKRRLSQLTDHLIQKQAQVEALSSEKATLLFRIEAVSRLLDENKSVDSSDPESATWDISDSRLRPLLADKLRSGRRHFGSLVQQLDTIFLAGAVFLRRNSAARFWALFYFVCLHFWVIYILSSHSPVSHEGKSGAVVSLENINNTGGV